MQNGIKKSKKKAPIICAAATVGLMVLYLAVLLFTLVSEAHGEVLALVVLLFYGCGIAAVIVGVLAALRQRLREIESGEEEDAKQY